MRTDQAATIHRLDYTPPDFLVDRVALVFDLLPDDTRVDSTLSLRRNPVADPRAPLVLDGEDLTLEALWLDGVALDPGRWRIADGRLVVDRVPDAFELRVITRLAPASNSTLSGLYVSNGNFFTQCEAQGFRRITFFPDRPDVMARYTVTLRAPREGFPMLLSNGNLVAEGDCQAPDGLEGAAGAAWHQAVWDDPFPKPSYLFALVAGKLAVTEEHLRTRSGRDVLLQVWAEPDNEDRTGHAMQSLVRAIRWDEGRFGLELDLDRYMIVAVSDFNMGAMENKGLNIFNSKLVLASPDTATDADYERIEAVIAHEYFHNWSGNRVTCRDWFQLSLKEGFTVFRDQSFSADMG
ncbi:MAG: M1 family aminopeptidase, partial [Gammaproteobacteria bacterium]